MARVGTCSSRCQPPASLNPSNRTANTRSSACPHCPPPSTPHLQRALPRECQRLCPVRLLRDGGTPRAGGLAALRAAHAAGVERDGHALLGDVQLQAVPAQHVLAHRGLAPRALQEGQVLLGARAGAGQRDVVDVRLGRLLAAPLPLLALLALRLRVHQVLVVGCGGGRRRAGSAGRVGWWQTG